MTMRNQRSSPKIEKPEDKKKTITAFLLMFPSLIIGIIGIATSNESAWFNLLIVGLLVYQFIMLQQFINDFYRSRGF